MLQKVHFFKLPSSLKIISNETLMKCKSLKEIEIPSSVESISALSLGKCCNLENVLKKILCDLYE